MSDSLNYKINVLDFVKRTKEALIKEIVFMEDENPLFNKAEFSFDFKYCDSIYIISGESNFKISTSLSDVGCEAFWITEAKIRDNKGSRKVINQIVSITWAEKNELPYRLEFRFPDQELILLTGEIYQTYTNKYDFKIQDEMILAFESKDEALKFESLANN